MQVTTSGRRDDEITFPLTRQIARITRYSPGSPATSATHWLVKVSANPAGSPGARRLNRAGGVRTHCARTHCGMSEATIGTIFVPASDVQSFARPANDIDHRGGSSSLN